MDKSLNKLAFAGKLEVKLAPPGAEVTEKTFSGYGAVFGNMDQASDIIAPGAFAETLAEHKAAGTSPAMFFNHDAWSMPIGTWDDLVEDDHGLKASGTFLDTVAGRDAYTAVKAGAVTGLSIGYYATDFLIEGGVRTILQAKLVEISVVTFPCNMSARVSDIKSAMADSEFLAKLNELGVDDDDAKALLAKHTKSSDEDEPEDDEKAEDDDASDEDDIEAKYTQTAIEAVSTLIREFKQENHGR